MGIHVNQFFYYTFGSAYKKSRFVVMFQEGANNLGMNYLTTLNGL
jgi:hypothetical protein